MKVTKPLATDAATTVRQDLCRAIQSLRSASCSGKDLHEEMTHLHCLLEALPLATSEYDTAINRLRNAYRYLVSQEVGAARYELRMLAAKFKPVDKDCASPQRHRRRSLQ